MDRWVLPPADAPAGGHYLRREGACIPRRSPNGRQLLDGGALTGAGGGIALRYRAEDSGFDCGHLIAGGPSTRDPGGRRVLADHPGTSHRITLRDRTIPMVFAALDATYPVTRRRTDLRTDQQRKVGLHRACRPHPESATSGSSRSVGTTR